MRHRDIIDSSLAILRRGDGSSQNDALLALLAGDEPDALKGVLSIYHDLSSAQRDQVVGYAARFDSVLSELIRDGDEQTRFNCVEFLSQAGVRKHAPLLGLCAGDDNRHVAEQAVAAIRGALGGFLVSRGAAFNDATTRGVSRCREVCDALREDDPEYPQLRNLLAALASALGALPGHDQNDVIDMLVRMGKRGDAVLLAELKQAFGRGKGRDAVLTDLRERPRAATFLLMFSMLGSGSANLRRIAIEFLDPSGEWGFRRVLIDTLKALGTEATARIVRQLGGIPWLGRLRGALDELGEDMVLAWIDAIEASISDVGRKLPLLREFLSARSEKVISRVFEIASGHYSPLVRPLLIELSAHESESVRYHALAALARGQFDGKLGLMKEQLSSESARIRGLAAGAIVSDQFSRYIGNFDAMGEEARRGSAELLRQMDPGVFEKLSVQLSASRGDDRLRAMRILGYTGVNERIESSLVALASDSDLRVRAGAPALLSQLNTPAAARSILEMLRDIDTRVKANAVEAVEQLGRPALGRALVPLLGSAAPRVKANAAKALVTLGSENSGQVLAWMARSRDPRMRIAAVWALANLGTRATMRHAIGVAQSETDRETQVRMLLFIDAARQAASDAVRDAQGASHPAVMAA